MNLIEALRELVDNLVNVTTCSKSAREMLRKDAHSKLESLLAAHPVGLSEEQVPFEKWSHAVLVAEGLADWKVEEGEPYCWLKSRTIHFRGEDPVLFLHEVAHALYPHMEPAVEGHDPNYYHGGNWAATFGKLVTKYMGLNVLLSDSVLKQITGPAGSSTR
ncbi:MAG: hypothetical protein ABSF14_19810 [Terriglobia bacterium]|jgi:hypothetical protein